ncbi:esterase-like activity of phytase family protein [Pseudoalteromonas xiamenensis]|uniref:esterase-like activity of phytase family protein n=1 Tax=Pseudoalteromonas xiamenensis TaxID=882626 RepID=UPI001FCB89FF|nr:esterase-like activity of phytase family protein [Pseudoalteromonas xiamenensis]
MKALQTRASITQDAALGLMVSGETLEQVVKNSAVGNDFSAGWAKLASLGITPAEKVDLIVDMVSTVQYPHDKMEGLWVIDDGRLGVLNDDDFATWSTNGVLEQKYLDNTQSRVDSNTLYIVNGLDLSTN